MDQKKLKEYDFTTLDGKTQPNFEKGKAKNIEEEIYFLTKLSMNVQEKNEKYIKKIIDKIKSNSGYQTIDNDFISELGNDKIEGSNKKKHPKIAKNFTKLEEINLVLKNSAYQIYRLQLNQFAECIKRIYRSSKSEYLINFDNTEEKIPSVILNEKDYKDLISIRDKYTSSEILTSFISKEDCINPNTIKEKKIIKSLTPRKFNNHTLIINKVKNKDDTFKNDSLNPNILFNHYNNNIHYLSSYNICHQCKLQKIDEDLIKCQYIFVPPNNHSNNGKTSKKSKTQNNNNNNDNNSINYYFIGQTAIIIANKIYYLRNYDDSIKELIENFFINKQNIQHKKCEKYYCKNCLRTVYDIDINDVKKKNFKCPSCSGRCNCSRCIRQDNLIKQIAYYLNNYGDIDKLYNYLIKKNSIFEKLKDYLLLMKFIRLDFSTKNISAPKINNIQNTSQQKVISDEPEDDMDIMEIIEYKKKLEENQVDFCNIYDESFLNKQLNDTKFFEIQQLKINDNETTTKKNGKLLGHKTKNPNNKKK